MMANVMVSATRDNYPVVEFSKGITPDKDPATLAHAQVLAQGQITSPPGSARFRAAGLPRPDLLRYGISG